MAENSEVRTGDGDKGHLDTTSGDHQVTVKDLKAIIDRHIPAKPASSAPPRSGLMFTPWTAVHTMLEPTNDCDEVYPGLFLGNAQIAQKKEILRDKWKITHVLNAAHGKKFNQLNTSDEYYAEVNIKFYGVPAMDMARYKMNAYFEPAADFMDSALNSGGRVLVHCQQGMSRSAILVLAFLVLKRQFSAEKALEEVLKHRNVAPNPGFLQQLCDMCNNKPP